MVPAQVSTSVVDPTPNAMPFPTATPELKPKLVPGTPDRVQELWAPTKGLALPQGSGREVVYWQPAKVGHFFAHLANRTEEVK